MVATIVLLAFAPTLGGYFLSDDFSYVYQLAAQRNNGQLLADVAAQFTRGLTSGADFYYRPLTYASFALDHLLYGASPLGFRLTNLLLHAANAAIVAALFICIARRLGMTSVNLGAVLAGLLFGLAPSSLEVAAWVSGRFDALATFFLLLTLLLFVRSDQWRHLAPVGLLLALASKESAVLTVVYAGLIALVVPPLATSNTTFGTRIRQDTMAMLPLLLVATLYFVWRWHIFGTPFKVYANSNSLPNLLSGAWLATMGAFPHWFRELTNESLIVLVLLVGAIISLSLSILGTFQSPGIRRMVLFCATALLVSYALVFSNNPAFASDGRHGRLFYQMLIPASWLLALPLAMLQHPQSSLSPRLARGQRILSIGAGALLLAATSFLGIAAIAAWRDAGVQSTALRSSLAPAAGSVPAGQYGIVFAPEWYGKIPFALNAQGGFILPPFQQSPLSSKLILQTEREFASLAALVENGLVTRLKRESLESILKNPSPADSTIAAEWPDRYWCWHSRSRSLRTMQAPVFAQRERFGAELQQAYAACVTTP